VSILVKKSSDTTTIKVSIWVRKKLDEVVKAEGHMTVDSALRSLLEQREHSKQRTK
jgi:hypothetical protein